MALILFVRHGQPDWPFADRLGLRGAQRDLVGLTARGVSQIEQTAVNVALEGAELILSSPYTRALHSAAIISRFRGLHVQVEHDLHEWIPDRTFSCEDFPEIRALADDFRRHGGEYPTGEERVWETISSVQSRVQGVLTRFDAYQKIVVVTHEMVIASITAVQEVEFAGIVEWQT